MELPDIIEALNKKEILDQFKLPFNDNYLVSCHAYSCLQYIKDDKYKQQESTYKFILERLNLTHDELLQRLASFDNCSGKS